jgi:hypothetical protein
MWQRERDREKLVYHHARSLLAVLIELLASLGRIVQW